MDQKNITYQLHSALFHVVDNLIITRDGLSFKVSKIFPDENGTNIEVKNKLRLTQFLFTEIFKKYNARIDRHNLLFDKIPKAYVNNLNLYNYALSKKQSHYSSTCDIFPRTFVCKKCGHFISFKNGKNEEFDTFDFENCQLGCGGTYEQIFQMKFCEVCGKLEPLMTPYANRGTWKLYRKDKFQPITWKLHSIDKAKEDPNYQPIDILRYPCSHNNRSNESSSRYTLLTATEGSIYHPVVYTIVDIPEKDIPEKSIDSLDLDYILLGIYLHKFDEFLSKNPPELEDTNTII